jgi:hypothetical protein
VVETCLVYRSSTRNGNGVSKNYVKVYKTELKHFEEGAD